MSSPTCSQCQNSSLDCRYQEGGKRGLPAAYITSLEQRLQETETALSASLGSLQESKEFGLLERNMAKASSATQQARSKAEKQDEWKRLPLQNSRHLAAWLQEKYHCDEISQSEQSKSQLPRPDIGPQNARKRRRLREETATASVIPKVDQRRGHEQTDRTLASDRHSLERLRNCDPPMVPNISIISSYSTKWYDNYF